MNDGPLDPALEYEDEEIGPGRVVQRVRVAERRSGGHLLDLTRTDWIALDGTVEADGAVTLSLSHLRSFARIGLTMRPEGTWQLRDAAGAAVGEALVGPAVPAALDAWNVAPLAERARALLAARAAEVPASTLVSEAVDALVAARAAGPIGREAHRALAVAPRFYAQRRQGNPHEAADAQLYWLLDELDRAAGVA